MVIGILLLQILSSYLCIGFLGRIVWLLITQSNNAIGKALLLLSLSLDCFILCTLCVLGIQLCIDTIPLCKMLELIELFNRYSRYIFRTSYIKANGSVRIN